MNRELIIEAIKKATNYNSRFFVYREPQSKIINFGVDNGIKSGNTFVAYPFVVSASTPKVMINASINASQFLDIDIIPSISNSQQFDSISTSKEEYLKKVTAIVDAIKNRKFEKVVFSNLFIYQRNDLDLAYIFDKLEKKYPSAFVFLFNAQECGTWIGATPETLLTKNGSKLRTMALAGTRPSQGSNPWNTKEIEEQNYVVQYITDLLSMLNVDYSISDRYTKQAGVIEHICNNILISENDDTKISHILKSLHPTPAIAGIPTQKAIQFLSELESHNRRYYGGYVGPMYNNGDFSFYVNLRSMQVTSDELHLYAGGGITKDSIPENEWLEIVRKSRTLLDAIQ